MIEPSVIPRVPPWLRPTRAALDALDAAAPVVLVQAPPGYGKTGTVAAWLDRGPERLRVWADVPAGADGEAFLAEVGRELERTREFGQVVSGLNAAGERPGLTLVVDRLDRLPEDVDARLLDRALAVGAQLVVIARRSRSLRAFAPARPTRVDEDRLRLRREDVLALAEQLGRPVPPEQAEALVAATAGWPAAVLAALREGDLPQGDGHPWRPGVILTGYVQTILLDPEFLRHRELLSLFGMVESVTDELAAVAVPDAAAPSQFSGSGPLRLERDEAGWRPPAVLRPALADLYQRLDPAADRALRTRLHRYHAERREWDLALEHAVATADAGLVGEFVAAHWPRLAIEARSALAVAVPLLEPTAPLREFLDRDVLEGASRLRGGRELVNGSLLSPASAPEPAPREGRDGGGGATGTPGAERPADPAGGDADGWRLQWAWTQFFEREHVAASEVFWGLSVHGDALLSSEARMGLALCLVHLGFVRAARDWWAQEAAAGVEAPSPTAAAARWLVEQLLRHEGQELDRPEWPEPAPERLSQLAEVSSASAELADYIDLRRLANGGPPAGGVADLAVAARAWSRARDHRPLVRAAITLSYVEQLVAAGRLEHAREVLAETSSVPGWDIALTARLDWLDGNFADVLRLTSASLTGAGLVDEVTRLSPRLHGQLLVLDALAALRLGRRDRAMNTLDAALELTRFTGYRRAWRIVPADDAERLVELLPALAQVVDRADRGGLEPVRGMVHLSPRELEVLNQWSQNRTVANIAESLFLSANSVKTHLRSIYRKLGVNDRASAVERARQLALLGRSGHRMSSR